MKAVLRAGAAAAVIFVAACDSPTRTTPTAKVISVQIDTMAGPLIRTATVRLDVPGTVDITYSAAGTPVLRISADSVALQHRVILPRLRAERQYSATVRADGSQPGVSAAFRTGALPANVAALDFTETGTPTHPVAIVEIVLGSAFVGVVMVEDGEVVWYHPTNGSLFGTTRRANGDIVLLDPSLGLVVVTMDGTTAHRLPQPSATVAASYGRIHHDVKATPSNTLLFIATDTHQIAGETVTGEALWEWNPEAGTVVKRWTAFDHLDWTTERGPRSSASNWLHGNGLAFGPRGNVLLSMRNIDQVASISSDFSRVEWTLGGVNGTLAISDDARFHGQHYVSEPAAGRLLVYDNGYARPGGENFTRVVEYAIDAVAGTASLVWQYRPSPDNYAELVGSAVRLGNGNTVVLFGMAGVAGAAVNPLTAVEVNANGIERWRLTPSAAVGRLYRVTPVPTLLGETTG